MEKTPELGAQTSIFLSVSPEVADISGEYFSDCQTTLLSPNASNAELARKLWDLSARLVGLSEAK